MVEFIRIEVLCDSDMVVRKVGGVCTPEVFGLRLTGSIDKALRQRLGVDCSRYAFVLACAPESAKVASDVSRDLESGHQVHDMGSTKH